MNTIRVAFRLCQGAAALKSLPRVSMTSLQQQAGLHGLLSSALPIIPILQARSFATGFDLNLPSRKHLFADLPLVSMLLPNRRDIAAQFSPHGITLIPKSILTVGQFGSIGDLGLAGNTSAPLEMEEEEQQETQYDGTIQVGTCLPS